MRVLRFTRCQETVSPEDIARGLPSSPPEQYVDIDSSEISALRKIIDAAAFQNPGAFGEKNGRTFECGDTINGSTLQAMMPAIRKFVGPRAVSNVDVSLGTREMLVTARDALSKFLENLPDPSSEPALEPSEAGRRVDWVSREDYDLLLYDLKPVDDLWEVLEPDYLYIGGNDINLVDLMKLLSFLEGSYKVGVDIGETETDEYDDDEDEDDE